LEDWAKLGWKKKGGRKRQIEMSKKRKRKDDDECDVKYEGLTKKLKIELEEVLKNVLSKEDDLVTFLKTNPETSDEGYEKFEASLNLLKKLIKHKEPKITRGETKRFGICTVDYNIITWENVFGYEVFYAFHARTRSLFLEIEDCDLRILYTKADTLECLKKYVYEKFIETWDEVVEEKKFEPKSKSTKRKNPVGCVIT